MTQDDVTMMMQELLKRHKGTDLAKLLDCSPAQVSLLASGARGKRISYERIVLFILPPKRVRERMKGASSSRGANTAKLDAGSYLAQA